MFQKSQPIEINGSTNPKVRDLNAERFARIVDAFKGNGYVYSAEGVFKGVGSWLGADGTDVADYIRSLDNYMINNEFGDSQEGLLDSIIFVMCAAESEAERAGSKVSDIKFKECVEELVKKGSMFTKESFLLAQTRGINLFEMWCTQYLKNGISADKIIDAFAVNDELIEIVDAKDMLSEILYIYYRYEQRDLQEVVPVKNQFEIDVLSIYETAISEKNIASYADESKALHNKSEELKRLTETTNAKLEEYRKAYSASEQAKREHENMSIESVKFDLRKLQEMASKYVADSLIVSDEIDVLMKQRAQNAAKISKLQEELGVFDINQLDESRMVQEVGQVRQLNTAITITKQEQIAELSRSNEMIEAQMNERRGRIAMYRSRYDRKLRDMAGLQEKLSICESIDGFSADWLGKLKSALDVRASLNSFLTTTHLQYKNIDCNALCIGSIEKHASAYFECLYSAVPVIGCRDDQGANILHRFFSCLNEKSKLDDKTGAERSTILNKHIIFSMLFLPELAIAQNQEGRTPLEVASSYLKGKTSFNAIAEEFVSRA